VRPALRLLCWLSLSDAALLITLVSGALLAALVTDLIGIQTIFGVFSFSAMVPHDSPRVARVLAKVETLCFSVLLPVFFTSSGCAFD
jgi:Kef-type K+ transport system membrane component KefB